jgi:hypothetical protein
MFGGHSITKESFDLICELMPEGGTLLELGSGRVTELFAEKYTLYSVENDPMWVDNYDCEYIYAPLVDDLWYDVEILKANLPVDYDMLLVDGPRTQERRAHILNNLELFRDDRVWLFDDVNQPGNLETFKKVAEVTGRDSKIVVVGTKHNGILYPKNEEK